MKLIIIFPNSLFSKNKIIERYTNNSNVSTIIDICIVEHPVYFTLYKYHKLKLILHRSSMKCYCDEIGEKYNITVKYIQFNKYEKFIKTAVKKYDEFIFYDPVENIITDEFKKYSVKLNIEQSKLFIADAEKLDSYDETVTGDSYVHGNFYKWMRKQFNILIKKDKPIGGKWSTDTSNRKPFPADVDVNNKNMYKITPVSNSYIDEAVEYVWKYFKDNPGNDKFYLPINSKDTIKHFKRFLKYRLKNFGMYQDAVNSEIDVGFHSLLSPMLNIGLITPGYIIKNVEKYSSKNNIPIQSTEGFIRQILGWREIMRLVYVQYDDILKTKNYFNHDRKLDYETWYSCKYSTEFECIDDCLDKAYDIGYLHHIERLMYIGNYFILNKIKPSDCYDWFMTFFIDSYNWVMSGNVYAMSQYSTGKFLMTRPYFSSSNYIAKMSNYKKNTYDIKLNIDNKEKYVSWDKVWDSLYYNFIYENSSKLKHNYATSYQVLNFNKKSSKEKSFYKKIANAYMDNY